MLSREYSRNASLHSRNYPGGADRTGCPSPEDHGTYGAAGLCPALYPSLSPGLQTVPGTWLSSCPHLMSGLGWLPVLLAPFPLQDILEPAGTLFLTRPVHPLSPRVKHKPSQCVWPPTEGCPRISLTCIRTYVCTCTYMYMTLKRMHVHDDEDI